FAAAYTAHTPRLSLLFFTFLLFLFFFFSDPPTTEIYTLSLHDALPISRAVRGGVLSVPSDLCNRVPAARQGPHAAGRRQCELGGDRKSTRLNSSHLGISYAVFCLKKKKENYEQVRNI